MCLPSTVKRIRKLILLVLLGLSCCVSGKKESDKAETQKVSSVDNEFEKYLNLLPLIKLPFETNCERCCDHSVLKTDNELINKFKPEGANIVGLVTRTDAIAIILVTYSADTNYPAVKVYDLKGNLKGDMAFLTGYCGGEPGYYERQFFRINSELLFSQIDTSYYMTIDSVEYQSLDTTRVEITKKDFRINETGELVETAKFTYRID